MTLLRRCLIAALVLGLLAAGALSLTLDYAARAAVERGGSAALGVPTHLDEASLSLFGGEVVLAGLRIENPPGFEDKPFLALERARTKVDLSSLRGEVARVELLELDSVSLLLQRRAGRSNYGVILEHLGAGDGERPAEPQGEGLRLNIERLVIRDIQADFDLLPLGGELTRAKITIPELVLEDVGNAEGGASLSEISARVVEALLQAALQAGGKVLSPELLSDLRQGLGKLGVEALDLGEGVLSEIGGVLQKVGGEAGKALQELGRGLGDVLGGKKKKD